MFSSVLLFLNIGTPELILILFVALLLFGGNKLPELARGLGKGLREFKEASDGVKREIHNQINSYDEPKPHEPVNTYTTTSTTAEESHPIVTEPQHTPVTTAETDTPVTKDINS
jgi:sec-independent protein translocase protein TatA